MVSEDASPSSENETAKPEPAPASPSDQTGIGRLLPFFLLLLGSLGLAFGVALTQPPGEPTVEVRSAPDMGLHEAADRFMDALRRGESLTASTLLLTDYDIARLGIAQIHPFGQSAEDRLKRAATMMAEAELRSLATTRVEPDASITSEFLLFQRRDLATGMERETRLWLARNHTGWRVGGFE